MKRISILLEPYQIYFIFTVLLLLSVSAFAYYFSTDKILLYGDANARLNIARGVIDSLTPGFGQLSNVWLPLPTILMLPLIWNSYLWHTGIAGAVVSMIAYTVGGVYLYKSARVLSNSFFAAFFSTLIYALNINLLYFQTTAMSETIFVTSLIIVIYNFLVWIKDNTKFLNLIYAGIAMTAASLIRYEAWAVMLASIPMVAFCLWIKTRDYKKTEGRTILYATVAVLGFLAWCLYLTALYGDPLYWKNVYLSQSFRVTSKGMLSGYTFNLTPLEAAWRYLKAIVWMNGIIPTILALLAIPLLVIDFIKKRVLYFLPLMTQLAIFAFMVLTLQRNTPISQPDLTLTNILSPKTLKMSEFNLRYGITMLPLVALLTVYVFNIRHILLRILLVLLLAIQLYSYFNPIYSVIYQIPIGNNIEMLKSDSINGSDMVNWLEKHYDGGLIMISAQKHNPDMLELGFNYKTYIHEGTGKYWKGSIKNPQKYATWILLDSYDEKDQVTRFLGNSPDLKQYYNLVYDKDGMKIYKIIDKTNITVK